MTLKYRNIAISGDSGTGTTTLAKNLAEKLGWKYFNTGQVVRAWYQEHNIPLEEATKIPEELDRQFEATGQERMKSESGLVFEARLAGWLSKDFPDVLRILCVADEETRMQRVARRENMTLEEARHKTNKRSQELQEKFEKLYGVKDTFDPQYFEIIIDTGKLNAQECQQAVLELFDIQ